MNWAPYRKLLAALIGAGAQAIALGLLPQAYAGWLTVIIGFATAAGVYAAPNTPTGGSAAG